MRKKIKKWLIPLIASVSTVSLVVPIVTSCATLKTDNFNSSIRESVYSYIYDNKVFNSIDEVATYYIKQKPNSVTDKLYLGDIQNAILDPSSQMLDINDLKPYDPNRMYPVYLNALNMPTYDYEAAKKSYVNKGLIDYQYYDFNNNLFPTYEEAKQSIINSKNPIGIFYYNDINVNDNKKINFNPLSKVDLLNFKKIAFEESLSNNASNFELKIYDNNSDKDYDSIIGQDFVHNIINEAIRIYFETKTNLLKSSKYNVSLEIDDNRLGDRHSYQIQNLKYVNKKYDVNQSQDNDTITFNNVSYDDMLKFNAFLNLDELLEIGERSIKKKGNFKEREVADEFHFNDFLGTSFDVKHTGNDEGGSGVIWNFDIGILRKGDEPKGKNWIAFKVDVDFAQNFVMNLETQLTNYLNTNLNQTNSFIDSIKKTVFKIVWKNLFNSDNKFDIGTHEWNGSGDSAKMTSISELNIQKVPDNWFLKGECYVTTNKSYPLMIGENANDNNDLMGKTTYNQNIIDNKNNNNTNQNLINNQIANYLFNNDNLNFVIEYNKSPVFQFGIKLDNFDQIIDKNIVSYANTDKNKKFITNIKQFVLQNINSNDFKNKNEFFNSFVNVSQKFTKSKSDDKLINRISNLDGNLFKFENNNLVLDYDFYSKLHNIEIPDENKNEILPELKNNVDIKYCLNSIVPFYNKLITQIKEKEPNNANKIIEEQFVDPKDIVVLYKEDKTLQFSYREFLSNNANFSANLVNNESIKLVNSKDELLELIESTTNVEPAKVVVIYDLLGNVINPGVQLSEDEKLLTTSDAIFDSAQTIIDNILRTKLVPRDLEKTFYLDDKNQYHLLKNDINQVYILNINNNQYYFPSHQTMMNELKKYLLTVTEKVVYEK